jgi:hypothetical protein
MSNFTRREWLAAAPGAILVAGAGAAAANSASSIEPRPIDPAGSIAEVARTLPQDAQPDRPRHHAEYPSQDPDRVREVVGASHANIGRVRELVEASPALAKAAWDWGFGDWETALGAASHVGRPDIAELLIKHGARPDVFTFAMMGKLAAVRACIEAVPGVQRIPGPHGITLLAHAGGERAAEVRSYLESLGDADPVAESLELSDDHKRMYVGSYRFGEGADQSLIVELDRRGNLSIKRAERFGRVLNRVEEHGFAPAGAPAVRVRFRVEADKCVALTIHDADAAVTAARMDG